MDWSWRWQKGLADQRGLSHRLTGFLWWLWKVGKSAAYRETQCRLGCTLVFCYRLNIFGRLQWKHFRHLRQTHRSLAMVHFFFPVVPLNGLRTFVLWKRNLEIGKALVLGPEKSLLKMHTGLARHKSLKMLIRTSSGEPVRGRVLKSLSIPSALGMFESTRAPPPLDSLKVCQCYRLQHNLEINKLVINGLPQMLKSSYGNVQPCMGLLWHLIPICCSSLDIYTSMPSFRVQFGHTLAK